MLGYMINTQEVGLYTVAVRIVRAISMLFACISTVILPRVTYYLGQGQKDKFDALIYKTLLFRGYTEPESARQKRGSMPRR